MICSRIAVWGGHHNLLALRIDQCHTLNQKGDSSMIELNDTQVVVTGAASGVGLATVKRCIDSGAKVAGLDLAPQESLSGLTPYVVDVSDVKSWQDFANQFDDKSIDYLHLNAGIQSAPPAAPMQDYHFGQLSVERYRKMVGVNIDGVVFGIHSLLSKMKPGGSIVVTGSLAGITPYNVDPLYSMSKHAVTGLVRSLKHELAKLDLRINAICPGGIDTALIPHEQRAQAEASQAEFMTGDDIAVEVLKLFEVEESGETWVKVAASKPAWVIQAPGQKKKSS
jgi:NAD(P)-dependent dehydrogenase (short-subunit alcohol dehydrogenase family)